MQYYNSTTKKIALASYLVSCGYSTELLSLYNWHELHIEDTPRYNIYTNYIVLDPPRYIDGKWMRTWSVKYLTPEQQRVAAIDLKNDIVSIIDQQTTDAILEGFSYVVQHDGEDLTLYFNYFYEDQRNFTDTAAVAVLYTLAGDDSSTMTSLPTSVTWTGYTDKDKTDVQDVVLDSTEFLMLYLAALQHKLLQLEIGKNKKHYITNTAMEMFQLMAYIEDNKLDIDMYNQER